MSICWFVFFIFDHLFQKMPCLPLFVSVCKHNTPFSHEVNWPCVRTSRVVTHKCKKSVSITLWWYNSISMHLKTFWPYLGGFSKLVYIARFLLRRICFMQFSWQWKRSYRHTAHIRVFFGSSHQSGKKDTCKKPWWEMTLTSRWTR